MTVQRLRISLRTAVVPAALLWLMANYFFPLSPVLAQDTGSYDPTGKRGLVQCGNASNDPCTVEDVFNIFLIGTNLLIGVVGLVTMLAIAYSGYNMVFAAGNTEGITKAKKSLTNSLIGFVLVIIAFVFVNLILYGVIGIKGDSKGIFNPLEYITGGNSDTSNNVPAPSNTPNTNIAPNTNTAPSNQK